MKSLLAAVLLVSALGWLGSPLLVLGASTNTCECWCGLRGDGARMNPGFSDVDSCRTKCAELDRTFVSCSFPGDGTSPHTNLRCWDAGSCGKSGNDRGEAGGKVADFQAAECLPGFTYCYPGETSINLSLAIGETTRVTGLGGYVGAFYRWILGAAAVFAVVMIIVGGIQYMLAGGSPKGVTQARDRILHALIGLVILLGSYVILATVNPQTLSLRTPPIPKVRTVETPGGTNTCESYYDRGYTIKANGSTSHNGRLSCGTEGQLKNGPDGETLPDGQVCRFTQCSGNPGVSVLTQCQQNVQVPSESACKTCEQFTFNEQTSPVPSATVCGGFSYLMQGTTQARCLYVPEAKTSVGLSQYNACAKVQFSCDAISSCGDYMNLTAIMAQGNASLHTIANGGSFASTVLSSVLSATPLSTLATLTLSPVWTLILKTYQQSPEPLYRICQENPCQEKIGACAFEVVSDHGPYVCRKPD